MYVVICSVSCAQTEKVTCLLARLGQCGINIINFTSPSGEVEWQGQCGIKY